MKPWLRLPLGAACLLTGGALVLWGGASMLLALTTTRGGLSLEHLFGVAIGMMGLGASVDLLGRRRADGAKEGTVAKSVWATRRDIDACGIGEDQQKPDEGLYLGSFTGEGAPVRLRYKGAKHLLCFGTPNANKSVGLAVPTLAHARRSIIVIDVKCQLAPISVRKRALLGKTIIINPFGVFADELPHLQSVGWNPLLQLDPKSIDFEEGAGCIADALIEKSDGGGNSKFFDNSAENLVAALVMWECFSKFTKGEKPSLANIRAELSKPTSYDKKTKQPISGLLHTLKLMADCTEVTAICEAGGRLYSRLTDRNSQATSAQDVIDTVLANTKFLSNPCIRADMALGGRIDFGALHREVMTIYFVLPPNQLLQAKWLRLFVNLALADLFKNPPTRSATLPPVLFMLDEFGNLGRLSQILGALNMSRDYSLQLWMFMQNLGQLKGSYPKDWTSFFSGAGALTTFQTGDSETQDELSKLFGNREEYIQTETVNGVSNTPHAIPLIRPEDISRLGRGETINRIDPCKMPVRGVAPVYTETPWNEGLDPNPYYRG